MHEKPWAAAAAPHFNFLKCIRITFFKKLKMIGPNGNTKSAHCSWQHDKTRYVFTLGSFWYSKLHWVNSSDIKSSDTYFSVAILT